MSSHKSLYFDEQRVNELAAHGVHSLETLKGWRERWGPGRGSLGLNVSAGFARNPMSGGGK